MVKINLPRITERRQESTIKLLKSTEVAVKQLFRIKNFFKKYVTSILSDIIDKLMRGSKP
jgi:hypothetical protein